MLFDLFELRRDAFDRFHNEDVYLSQMNGTGDYKAVILKYVTGRKVLDIGPGGGYIFWRQTKCCGWSGMLRIFRDA
ncbi:hypothetical protein [Paenibacillus sp. NPDC057934]|uniref:hypothetical protein n=1 Tax=Paenibacillus sp. NPDC057934 TaxID=3346282 RepID=UPI0036DE7A37